MSRPIRPDEEALLARIKTLARQTRVALEEGMTRRPATYTGLPNTDPGALYTLTLKIQDELALLCLLVSDKNDRDFYHDWGFGAVGLHRVNNPSLTFEQNCDILQKWIERYLNWLESPLERIAREVDGAEAQDAQATRA